MSFLDSTAVIIPAAGEGKRLGLDIPKELFEIIPGKRLIDFTMELIPAETGKVCVVIRDGKESIPGYLAGKYPRHNFEYVYFNDSYREWPGSVFSASESFLEYNVVLLPDSFLIPFGNVDRPESGRKMLETFVTLLKSFELVFAVKREDGDALKNLGALFMDESGKITRFADKPRNEYHRFNGYWAAYGFRRESGEKVYRYLIDAVDKNNDLDFIPLNATGFEIYSYTDLGTPESVKKFKQENL